MSVSALYGERAWSGVLEVPSYKFVDVIFWIFHIYIVLFTISLISEIVQEGLNHIDSRRSVASIARLLIELNFSLARLFSSAFSALTLSLSALRFLISFPNFSSSLPFFSSYSCSSLLFFSEYSLSREFTFLL